MEILFGIMFVLAMSYCLVGCTKLLIFSVKRLKEPETESWMDFVEYDEYLVMNGIADTKENKRAWRRKYGV